MEHWNLLIAAHAIGATFALLAGLVVLRAPRKGNVFHRRLGRVWMAAMYWTALSSFGIRELRPGHLSWIHALSAWTVVSLTVALWAARTRRRRLHRQFVVGSYLGLLGAGLAAMAFPTRLAPQLLVHRPAVFTAAVVGTAIAVAVVVRLARRDAARSGPAIRTPGALPGRVAAPTSAEVR